MNLFVCGWGTLKPDLARPHIQNTICYRGQNSRHNAGKIIGLSYVVENTRMKIVESDLFVKGGCSSVLSLRKRGSTRSGSPTILRYQQCSGIGVTQCAVLGKDHQILNSALELTSHNALFSERITRHSIQQCGLNDLAGRGYRMNALVKGYLTRSYFLHHIVSQPVIPLNTIALDTGMKRGHQLGPTLNQQKRDKLQCPKEEGRGGRKGRRPSSRQISDRKNIQPRQDPRIFNLTKRDSNSSMILPSLKTPPKF